MVTHSSVLAWKSPWTEELGGLQSMGSQRVGCNLVTKEQQQQRSHRSHHEKPHSSFQFWKLSCRKLAEDTALCIEGLCPNLFAQVRSWEYVVTTVGMWCKAGFPKLREEARTSDTNTQVQSPRARSPRPRNKDLLK